MVQPSRSSRSRGRDRDSRPHTGASRVSIRTSPTRHESPERRSASPLARRSRARSRSKGNSVGSRHSIGSTDMSDRSRSRSRGRSRGSSKSRRAEVAVSDALYFLPEAAAEDEKGRRRALEGETLKRTLKSLRDLALPMSTRPEVRQRFRESGSISAVTDLAKSGTDPRVMLLSMQLLSRSFTDRFRVDPSIDAYVDNSNQLFFNQECGGLLALLDVLQAPMAGAKGVNDDVRSAACTTAADAMYMCEENRESAMKAGFIPALQRLITSSRCGAVTQGTAARCLSVLNSEDQVATLIIDGTYPHIISLLSSVHPTCKIGAMLALSAGAAHKEADAVLEGLAVFSAVASMLDEPSGAVCAAALRCITVMLQIDKESEHLPARVTAAQKLGVIPKALSMLKCNDSDMCASAVGLIAQLFEVKPMKKLRKPKADEAVSPERSKALAGSKGATGKSAATPAKGKPGATPAKTAAKPKPIAAADAKQPLAEYLREKHPDALREAIGQLLSSPTDSIVDSGLRLSTILVAQGGDFLEMVSQRSNSWAMTSLIVRDNVGQEEKMKALGLLEKVATTVAGVRVHLENEAVKALIEATKGEEHDEKDDEEKAKLFKEMRQARMEARAAELKAAKAKMAKSEGKGGKPGSSASKTRRQSTAGSNKNEVTRSDATVRDLNGQTVDDDVLGALYVLNDQGQGEMMRIEAIRWLQGIVRADKHGRELLMVSGFVERAIDLLRADPVLVTPAIKVGCVDLISDVCTNIWFTPRGSEHVWFDQTHQSIVMAEGKGFHQLSLLAAQLFRDERTLTEAGAARLMEASCRALMSVVKSNSAAQIASARSGLLYAAGEMAASQTRLYQRLGVGMIEFILSGSPVISRVATRLGEPTPDGPWLATVLAQRLSPQGSEIVIEGDGGIGSPVDKGASTTVKSKASAAASTATARGRGSTLGRGGTAQAGGLKKALDEKEFKAQARHAQQLMREEMEPATISACLALAAMCDSIAAEGRSRSKREWVGRLGTYALPLLSSENGWVRASAASMLCAIRRCWPEGAVNPVPSELVSSRPGTTQTQSSKPGSRPGTALSVATGEDGEFGKANGGDNGGVVLDEAVERMMLPDERLSVVIRSCVMLLCTELRCGSEGKLGMARAKSICGARLSAMVLALDASSFSDVEKSIDQYCMADRRVRESFYEEGGLQFVTGALSETGMYALNPEDLVGMRECCAHVLGSLASSDAMWPVDEPESDADAPRISLSSNFETPSVRKAVTELVHSLSGGVGRTAVFARALGALGTNRTIRTSVVAKEALMPLTGTLTSDKHDAVEAAANAIAILSSHWLDVKMRQRCKLAGVIPPLINGLMLPHTGAQAACALALGNLAKSESDVRAVLTQHRGVEHVARLLRCQTSTLVQVRAAHCIADVAETATGAKQLIEQHAVQAICKLISTKVQAKVAAAAKVLGSFGNKVDQFGMKGWSTLRKRIVTGGGLSGMIDIVNAATEQEVARIQSRMQSAEAEGEVSAEEEISATEKVKLRPKTLESRPRTTESQSGASGATRQDVVAIVDALGKLSKAADMKQPMIDAGAMAAVLGLAQLEEVSVEIRCACLQAAAHLWIELVVIESDESDTDEEPSSKKLAELRDPEVGEWILTTAMGMLRSSTPSERVAACSCCRTLVSDPSMVEGLRAGQLFEHCMYFLEEGQPGVEREAVSAALEALCKAIPDCAGNCTVPATAALYERLASESITGIEQAARTMGAMAAASEEGLECVTREVPGVKQEGITLLVEVLQQCPAVSVQSEMCNTLRIIALDKRWSFVVCELAGEKFIEMLQMDKLDAVLSACRALAGLAEQSDNGRHKLRMAGLCPVLDGLLGDSSEDIRLAACTAIKHMAKDDQSNDIFVKIGTVRNLVDIQRYQSVKMVRRATDTLFIMFKHVNVQFTYVEIGGLEALEEMLAHESPHVQECSGRLLKRLFRNPRIKTMACEHTILEALTLAASAEGERDDAVRAMACDAMCTLSGNAVSINMPQRASLLEHGLVASAVDLLSCTTHVARRAAADTIANLAVLPHVQDEVRKLGAIDILTGLVADTSTTGPVLASVCRALSRLCKGNAPNRFEVLRNKGTEYLPQLLTWVPAKTSVRPTSKPSAADLGPEKRAGIAPAQAAQGAFREALNKLGKKSMSAGNLYKHAPKKQVMSVDEEAKMTHAVRGAAADAVASLLDCPGCRRSYAGICSGHIDINGNHLYLPPMSTAYACTHHDQCKLCVSGIAEHKDVLPSLLSLAKSEVSSLRCSAVLCFAAMSVGAPYHGVCKIGEAVREFALKEGFLPILYSMIRPGPAVDKGVATSLQFSAARALSDLAVSDDIKVEACKSGFLREICGMLYSTYGRVKGCAAVAFARLASSDTLVFWWDKNTNHTFWDMPDDLVRIASAASPTGYVDLAEEDVMYDEVKKCYWVRGVMKPYERVCYKDMLTAVMQVKFGPMAGGVTLKADSSCYSKLGALDVILDIFRSPLFDGEVSSWAAEATSLLCEFETNRAIIAATEGCVDLIVRLLKSQHVVWQEQACTTLTTLLEDRMARRQAGESGAAVALADLIRGPYTPNSLVRVATVAIARLCSDNSSQVLVLEAGGLMPLAEMLSHEEEQRWYAAAEALAMCSSNDTNKRLLGDAGTVTAVLRRLHNDSPRAIQARVLAVAIRLICDQRNLDIAVEGGILPRLTVMSGDGADALILQYISLALQTLSRAVRHLPVLLQEGLIECIRAILLRVTEDGEFVSTPEAATVRSSLSDVLLSLSRVDGLRSSLVERGALPLAVGLMKCPENTVMADSCTVVALIAANKDEWKDAAREAGCIPQVSRLVCSKNMQVRLEAAAAVRALATNIVNKRELVEAGALHGLRDLMDISNGEAKARASEAMYRLSNNQVNAFDMSRAGALRPLVQLVGTASTQDSRLRPQAAESIGRIAKIHVWDTRVDAANYGAIPALGRALFDMRGDDEGSGKVTKALRILSRHDALDAHASHTAKSDIVAGGREGLVPHDPVARANRESMSRQGIRARLSEIVDSSRDGELVHQARATMNQLDHLDVEVGSRGRSRGGTGDAGSRTGTPAGGA